MSDKARMHRASKNARSRLAPAGFTLLEILIAMAILAVIATMVYASFDSSVDVIARVDLDADMYREARFVLGRLTEELAMAYRPEGEAYGDAVFVGLDNWVDGRPSDSLRFTSVSNLRYLPEEAASEINLLEYRLEVDPENGQWVLLRDELANPLALAGSGSGQFAVGEGVHSFNLRYFDGEGWVDSWDADSRKGLPLVVEIEIRFARSAEEPGIFRSWVRLPMARPEGLN